MLCFYINNTIVTGRTVVKLGFTVTIDASQGAAIPWVCTSLLRVALPVSKHQDLIVFVNNVLWDQCVHRLTILVGKLVAMDPGNSCARILTKSIIRALSFNL